MMLQKNRHYIFINFYYIPRSFLAINDWILLFFIFWNKFWKLFNASVGLIYNESYEYIQVYIFVFGVCLCHLYIF